MTEVIARVHSVHLVKVEQRHAAADCQTKLPEINVRANAHRACRLVCTPSVDVLAAAAAAAAAADSSARLIRVALAGRL